MSPVFRLPVRLAAGAVLAGCSSSHSALDPAGPLAGRIADLWWIFLAVSAVTYGIVIALLLRALVRGRRAPREPQDEQLRSADRRATVAVGIGIALTTVTLVALVASDFVVGRTLERRHADALRVRINGNQWWWEIEYEDPVPSNRILTANELHVPLGRPVELTLTSRDVIHSFWVPNLHGKKDLIPGHVTTSRLLAERPGLYTGQCAEFCGHQHANMRLVVHVDTPAQFAAWQSSQRRPAREPETERQRRGQQVFLTSACIMCHAIGGTEASASVGPNLTHLASRTTLAAGALPNTRGHLAGWIANPQAIKPGNRMPAATAPPEELAALVDYLASLE